MVQHVHEGSDALVSSKDWHPNRVPKLWVREDVAGVSSISSM